MTSHRRKRPPLRKRPRRAARQKEIKAAKAAAETKRRVTPEPNAIKPLPLPGAASRTTRPTTKAEPVIVSAPEPQPEPPAPPTYISPPAEPLDYLGEDQAVAATAILLAAIWISIGVAAIIALWP